MTTSLKKKTTTNNIILNENAILNESATRFAASLFDLGNIIDNSYRAVTIAPNIDVRLINKANTPKSSGEYNLVKIGLIAIGNA